MQTNVRDAFEQVLRRRRAELMREAAERTVARRALDEEGERELVERAQEAELRQILNGLDDCQRREITDIDGALARLADGSYGRCTHCDAAIEIDRLATLPETAHCMDCASALEF